MFTKFTLALAMVACLPAQAAVVTALPGSTTYAIPVENYFGAGPKTIAPGITWSSDYASSVYGYENGYVFGDNGDWSAGLSMIGSNDDLAKMTITFDNPVAGVGMFWNFAPDDGSGLSPAVIAVYDTSNNLIESHTLTDIVGTGTNQGKFYAFLENTASISYMTMQGAFIGGANLEVLSAPTGVVPEPATYALALAGLGVAGVVARRGRRQHHSAA